MDGHEANPLLRFSEHRFRSFSEAAELLVGILGETLRGTVALTRVEPDQPVHRVLDARGRGVEGLAPGALLPAAGDGVDSDALQNLGAGSWISAPLETGDGQIVGILLAADTGPEGYHPNQQAQLGLAARLLGYEWENVELRSELRRLRRRLNAGPMFDSETGLATRESFLERLGHEWRLAQRGTVQSVVLACRVDTSVGTGNGNGNGNGVSARKRSLALKVAAEVLEGTARETDMVGRVGEQTLAAVLLGCRPEDTPHFVARFLSALERVTGEEQAEARVSCGVQPLAGTGSPEDALQMAESSTDELVGPAHATEATVR